VNKRKSQSPRHILLKYTIKIQLIIEIRKNVSKPLLELMRPEIFNQVNRLMTFHLLKGTFLVAEVSSAPGVVAAELASLAAEIFTGDAVAIFWGFPWLWLCFDWFHFLIEITFLVTEVSSAPGVVAAELAGLAAEMAARDAVTIFWCFLWFQFCSHWLYFPFEIAFLVAIVSTTHGVIAAELTNIAAEILTGDAITILTDVSANVGIKRRYDGDDDKNRKFRHLSSFFAFDELI
jgi:ribosomal protein S8